MLMLKLGMRSSSFELFAVLVGSRSPELRHGRQRSLKRSLSFLNTGGVTGSDCIDPVLDEGHFGGVLESCTLQDGGRPDKVYSLILKEK